MILGFLNLTKFLIHPAMDFCTWSDHFLDVNICFLENNSYYHNLRLKEKVLNIESNVPILNFEDIDGFNKLLLKLDKDLIICNLLYNDLQVDDYYAFFKKFNILFLIIETDKQLIIAEQLKKELNCSVYYIILSEQKINHKNFLFFCHKFTDIGRTYYYKNYNQILYSKIFSKINFF